MAPALDLAGGTRLGALAASEARARNAGGSIAIVDAGGHLLFLERLDHTFPAAAAVSIEKARTAATFRMPTRSFEEAIRNGRHALLGVDVMTPLQGGVPVSVDGQVVGAIGVSGAHSAHDHGGIPFLEELNAVERDLDVLEHRVQLGSRCGRCRLDLARRRQCVLRALPGHPQLVQDQQNRLRQVQR